MAAGACKSYDYDMEKIKRKATEIMLNTITDDAIEVYSVFPKAKVRVRRDVPESDLTDEASIQETRDKKLSYYEILTISASYDLISRELVGGFELTFRYAALVKDFAKEKCINDAITHAYLRLFSEEEDTFIKMKFGSEKSKYVKDRATQVINQGYKCKEVEELDEELIREELNPRSTADIIAAALFVSILGGLTV
jgi:triphosphoribosyl-dephospho-CoA synthase